MNQDNPTPPQSEHPLQHPSRLSAQGLDSEYLDRVLMTMLNRFDCPTPDDIAAYAWQELTGQARERLAHHLNTCERCANELQLLRRSYNLVAAEQTATAAGVYGLGNWIEKTKWWVARLLPTSPELRPALRGEQDVALLPRIYRVEELGWEVMVTVSIAEGGYAISGSLLGPSEIDLTQGRATLLQADQESSTTLLDAAGGFDLAAVQDTHLTLWLELPNQRIELVL